MNEPHVSTDVERAISDLGDLVWPDGWALPLPAKIIDWLLRRGWFDWKSLIGRSVRRRWVGGWVRYQLDSRETARRVLSLNDKEPGTITLLATELRLGDVFLDVGASVGIYAIPAAGRVGSSGVVVAVEPRDAGDVIVQHARLNGFESRVQRISRPAVSGGQDSIDVMIERGLILSLIHI